MSGSEYNTHCVGRQWMRRKRLQLSSISNTTNNRLIVADSRSDPPPTVTTPHTTSYSFLHASAIIIRNNNNNNPCLVVADGWLGSRVVSVRYSGAVATLSGNSLRQTVHTHHVSIHQAAKLVAALLTVARVTAGLAESNGSVLPGL